MRHCNHYCKSVCSWSALFALFSKNSQQKDTQTRTNGWRRAPWAMSAEDAFVLFSLEQPPTPSSHLITTLPTNTLLFCSKLNVGVQGPSALTESRSVTLAGDDDASGNPEWRAQLQSIGQTSVVTESARVYCASRQYLVSSLHLHCRPAARALSNIDTFARACTVSTLHTIKRTNSSIYGRVDQRNNRGVVRFALGDNQKDTPIRHRHRDCLCDVQQSSDDCIFN